MTDSLRSKATETYAQARRKAEKALSTSRSKAEQALSTGRSKLRDGASATRVRAKAAQEKARNGLSSNPLTAVAGGLALGAIIAALLPKTQREKRLMGSVSRSVKSTAKRAAKVASGVAKAELIALGVSSDAARKQVRDLAGKIGKAASTAGQAAAKTVRKDKSNNE